MGLFDLLSRRPYFKFKLFEYLEINNRTLTIKQPYYFEFKCCPHLLSNTLYYLFIFLDKNQCLDNPCQNGGTFTQSDECFTCSCTDGFVGAYCTEGKHIIIFPPLLKQISCSCVSLFHWIMNWFLMFKYNLNNSDFLNFKIYL